ncbi:putative 4-mercaptohistidine N1-methyltransferase [Luteolibacter yonseiensis]|uniref:4-mercaptohistidine N1-methyltransferase n=1 Tax=Luteolibacter yonseiensis TaxID=1144680 RepID=A0A934VAJ3_9BACT|nr:putative 4-mercaptohistidine N1-methyltransferase [Luteolibacter yonseiensis]MBK1814434.1 putative 4-mercaptohistidine N1-methyltransferase [Luteolibacter yonseiensis]
MSDIYESEKILSEYLLFHFGQAGEILTTDRTWPAGMREALDFPVRTAAHFSAGEVGRGLDLGCAVGRSAFEMSRTCRKVTGIDFSHAFIQAAETLRSGRVLSYERREEAALTTRLEAALPAGVDGERLSFLQGDAMDLPADLDGFDRVHAANLLCRLPQPERLLERLPSLVRAGGELVLATPCTWLEEFTPVENWPKGGTFDWLKSKLSTDFELVRQADEPFLIRETARKFQWTTSLVTVWRRLA